jgi:enoyl-CoA hydratase
MEDLQVHVADGLARVTLNRPQALNALTLDMAMALDAALARWATDPAVRAVVLRGAGDRAFSAGGDIRALYESGTTKSNTLTRDFYWHEYRLNRRIKRYGKPYVALMDGVAMGGGVGVSVHGSHRVATERTLFAMPETGIGLFPDVGGSYFLPRCPGKIGLYLALTGTRLNAADCLHAGIVTHHVPAARLDDLTNALGREPGDVGSVLARFHQDPGPSTLVANRAGIDRCFDAPSVEAIQDRLAAEDGDWASKARAAMAEKSPFLQKIAFLQVTRGARLEFEEAMVMEFRLVQRAMSFHEFYEGVRAAVIDKDRAPKWRPATLAEVDAAEVEAWFAPLPDGDLVFA